MGYDCQTVRGFVSRGNTSDAETGPRSCDPRRALAKPLTVSACQIRLHRPPGFRFPNAE
jgi:hypothetical protein